MKYKKTVWRSLAMVTQFGLSMLVPIFLCSFLGIFLGNWLSLPVLMVPFFLLGAAAGFRNVYIMAKSVFNNHEEDDHDQF